MPRRGKSITRRVKGLCLEIKDAAEELIGGLKSLEVGFERMRVHHHFRKFPARIDVGLLNGLKAICCPVIDYRARSVGFLYAGSHTPLYAFTEGDPSAFVFLRTTVGHVIAIGIDFSAIGLKGTECRLRR